LKPIPYTGISVKLAISKSYTIIKMAPGSFEKLIGNRILGAAASIYDKNPEDFKKNIQVLSCWKVTIDQLNKWMEQHNIIKSNETVDLLNHSLLKKIKNKAIQEIKYKIHSNQTLKFKLFWGTGIFPEPFSASYFYYKEKLAKVEDIDMDFTITTGSGRSKGICTLVLKPKGLPSIKKVTAEF
jgi:hypothetical protein